MMRVLIGGADPRLLHRIAGVLQRVRPDAEVTLWSDAFNPGISTVGDARRLLVEADVVIFDYGSTSLRGVTNLLFELGLAQGLGKPVLVLAAAENAPSLPSDLSGLAVALYSESDPKDLDARLAAVLADALDSPQRLVPGLQRTGGARGDVFVSYSHNDGLYLQRLLVHLRPLERAGLVKVWADTQLAAGDLWREQIAAALDQASVAVLLVSADFLASEFIVSEELPRLLQNAQSRGTRILPIVVTPCRFSRDPALNRFQAANDPREPLSLLPEAQWDRIFDTVAAEIEQLVGPPQSHQAADRVAR